jgi:flagellar hook-basal body complex protein FliE
MIASLQSLFGGKAVAAPDNLEAALPPVAAPQTAAGPAQTAFSDILDQFVGDVNTQMNTAGTEQAKLLAGDTTNLHQAMISMQEANTAFSLMVEVRNKLVDGYQELMRMQI